MQFLNLRMEQEKFSSMNQSSSNTNMPRDTVETLKQIQKQGLSVSIIKSSGGSSSSSSAAADNRSKANILPAEKTAKITPVTPSRSQTTTENKAQILTARLPSITDNRGLQTPRSTSQSGFLDNKVTANQTRSNQPSVSESKGFTPAWSTSNSSIDKTQANVSRPVVTTPVSKMQTGQVRVTPVSRSNQSMHSEGKNQARVPTGQRIPQSPQLIEGKLQNNQERVNPTTSSDVKSFSNQGRMGQQFAISQDKSTPVQKSAPQKAADAKTTSQLNTNKPVDVKAPVNRVTPNLKVMSDVNQNKIRSNYAAKPEAKTSITGLPPMIVENKTTVNSVRLVNVVDGNSTRTTQQLSKSSSSQMRIHPNVCGGETSAVQTKMICTSVHTKTMVFQHSACDKIILQGNKIDPEMIQKFDMSAEALHGNSTSRGSTTKRSGAVVSSPVKKKCVKRPSPSSEMSNKNLDGNNVNSPEDGNEKAEAHFLNNINTRAGLTITPVRPSLVSTSSASASSVGMLRMHGELLDLKHQNLGNTWGKAAALVKSPRGKARSRGRRRLEPVCLTLSSDEEEEHMHASFNTFEEALGHQMFHHESEGSKSGQSSPVYQDEDNPESDDPHFPGVTDINPKPREEEPYEDEEEDDEEEKELDEMEMEEESMGEEEEEEMEESEMDEEEVPPEDEEPNPMMQTSNPCIQRTIITTMVPLLCRSVRIGSFKIHPFNNNKTLNVYLDSDEISFNSPLVSDASKIVKVTVKPSDVTHMLVHFGKCLPIVFIYTTPSSAEGIRKLLTMFHNDQGFYDPNSNDEKQKKLTFLIDAVTEEQRHFFRYSFVNEKKLQEIDQKTANEILVKSTPSNTTGQIVRCEIITLQPQPQPQPPPPPQPVQVSQENVLTVTAIQSPMVKVINTKPATRLFTYPPPPQTGGIPITTEDVACLNEGEFLNDAIIDFYLKYVFYEKLSDYNRDKTHIFSSYFYHRLTHKPERARPGDDVQKNIQMRRHSQVKTWTRHVDIFSKDFIIIPVNQNVHWFLAIICYPGLVPEAPDSPIKSDIKTSKSTDVTSTDDQDENKTSKEPNSTVDDENSTSSNSMFENEEPDTEEPAPEAPDSSTHPDKNWRKKEVPCICIFDSLNGPNRSRIATMLREYLEVEWKLKKGTRKVFDKSTMHGYIMQCPQQTNYSDCGIYVLQYVESFFENPLPYFDTPIPNLSNWFPKEKVAKKREELKELIFNLQKKYAAIAASRIKNTAENVPSSQSQLPQNDNR